MLATGLLAQALQYSAGILLLPLITSHLSSSSVGMWYLFLTVQGLALMIDFGFQGTFSRSFALAWAGASNLQKHGVEAEPCEGREPNQQLFADLVASARRLYAAASTLAVLLLLTAGWAYVAHMAARDGLAMAPTSAAWVLFVASIGLDIYFNWISAALIGTGRTEQNFILLIIVRLGFSAAGAVVLLLGGGIVGLAAAQLVAILAGRLTGITFLRPLLKDGATPDRNKTRDMLRLLWPNAGRLGVAAVAGFLILRANLFVVASFVGLSAAASYGITLQLLSALLAVGQLPLSFALPQVVKAYVAGDQTRIWRMTLGMSTFFLLVFVCGTLLLIVAGRPLLDAIGSRVQLLPAGALVLFSFVLMLEGLHTISAAVIASGNRVPFMLPSIVSGIGVVTTSAVAASLGAGIAGVIACQGLVQLAYNNWRWPLMVYRETHR